MKLPKPEHLEGGWSISLGFTESGFAAYAPCSADRPVDQRRRSIVHSALLAFAISASAFGAAEQPTITGPVTATKVHRLIDSVGPHTAVRQLFGNRELETAVLDGIATGGAGWLRVAERLKPESDAAASEGLVVAIQEALPKNSSGVLNLVHRGAFRVAHACGGYGFGQIEDERPTSVLLGLIDKRIRAVRGVREPQLEKEQQACIEVLTNVRSALERLER